MNTLIVFLGAGLGGVLRHGVNVIAPRWLGYGFPWPTLIVNMTGSFAMGLIVAYFALRGEAPQAWRLFLTTGVLGGFTTFSAFSLEAVLLYERGQWLLCAAYVLASVVLSVGGLGAGLWLGRVGT
jgi:CrcB protein